MYLTLSLLTFYLLFLIGPGGNRLISFSFINIFLIYLSYFCISLQGGEASLIFYDGLSSLKEQQIIGCLLLLIFTIIYFV
jgi:hypothetical protein